VKKNHLLYLACMLVMAPAMAQTAQGESAVQAAQLASIKQRGAVVARAYAKPDAAASLASIAPKVHFEAVNPGEPAGDRLGSARRMAAAIVAQDLPAPLSIVDVGSFTGEFLEAFMQRFPQSRGQWTEPVSGNEDNARHRLARFGKNVDYVIGCPSRDISQGCVPENVDVLLTSWLSIHQDQNGIRKFYKEAAARLPAGGWLVNLDHIAADQPIWALRLDGAREELAATGINAIVEGPPVHHTEYVAPSLADQLASLNEAGFTDVNVVWRRLDTVLLLARKSGGGK
jgi:hypothetical protein